MIYFHEKRIVFTISMTVKWSAACNLQKRMVFAVLITYTLRYLKVTYKSEIMVDCYPMGSRNVRSSDQYEGYVHFFTIIFIFVISDSGHVLHCYYEIKIPMTFLRWPYIFYFLCAWCSSITFIMIFFFCISCIYYFWCANQMFVPAYTR